jgi:hypothetical protein
MFRQGDRFQDIVKYNEVAAGVMKEHQIEIDDLYAFVLPNVTQWQRADQAHFNDLGNKNLGEKVGKSILDALIDAGKLGKGTEHPSHLARIMHELKEPATDLH